MPDTLFTPVDKSIGNPATSHQPNPPREPRKVRDWSFEKICRFVKARSTRLFPDPRAVPDHATDSPPPDPACHCLGDFAGILAGVPASRGACRRNRAQSGQPPGPPRFVRRTDPGAIRKPRPGAAARYGKLWRGGIGNGPQRLRGRGPGQRNLTRDPVDAALPVRTALARIEGHSRIDRVRRVDHESRVGMG